MRLRAAAAREKGKLSGDAKTGAEIVHRALEEPIRQAGGTAPLGR